MSNSKNYVNNEKVLICQFLYTIKIYHSKIVRFFNHIDPSRRIPINSNCKEFCAFNYRSKPGDKKHYALMY